MYIPQNSEDLVQKCKLCGFRGTFLIINSDTVIWRVDEHITLRIILHHTFNDEGYIEEWYDYLENGKIDTQGHWHPMAEEIWRDLKNINDNETAILRKSIFGTRVIVDNKENISKLKDSYFVKYKPIYR